MAVAREHDRRVPPDQRSESADAPPGRVRRLSAEPGPTTTPQHLRGVYMRRDPQIQRSVQRR